MPKSIHKDDDELNGIVGTFFKAEHANKIQNQVPTGEDIDGSIPVLYGIDIGAADAYAVDLVFGKKITSGTNTSVATNKLIVTGETFITKGVEVGHTVPNIDDRTEAKVTSVDSETQLTLDADIFTATGKKYAAGPDVFQAPLTYKTGLEITFIATNANTGASTININGLGVKSIKLIDGSALKKGDIQGSQIVKLFYNGTDFLLLNPAQVRSGCKYHMNSVHQTITTSTTTKLHLTTKVFDHNNEFDNVTEYEFKPKQAGDYLLIGHAMWNGTMTGDNRLYFYKGAAAVVGHLDTVGAKLICSCVEQFDGVSDAVNMSVWQMSGSDKEIVGNPELTHFSAYRLGR
jgi:hypothetical protein